MLTILMFCAVCAAAELPEGANALWQPQIARLASEYRRALNHVTLGYKENLLRVVAEFETHIEKEPIKHREKLYGYYAHLLCLAGKYDKALQWAQEALKLPYKNYTNSGEPLRIVGLAAYELNDVKTREHRWRLYYESLKPFPAASSNLGREEALNKIIKGKAWGAKLAAENLRSKTMRQKLPIKNIYRDINYDKLVEIGDLWLGMGDLPRALHGYTQAHISYQPGASVKHSTVQPHPIWEKIATAYELFGDWDQALATRLSQLCDAHNAPPPLLENLNQRIIELLARIGAEEKIKTPQLQYDLEKLDRMLGLYLEQHLPNLGEKVVEVMEKTAGKELPEPRARLWEAKANTLSHVTADPEAVFFRVVLWGEVWTYDKIVAAHKQAIAWAKKAQWPEERIKKLEDQITKLPDLLKYVKEPKNFKEMIEGKATEPKW